MSNWSSSRTGRTAVTLGAAVVVAVASVVAVTSAPAGAAPNAIAGDATVAIGFEGTELGVPESSTFTGSLDDTAGTVDVTVADTDMAMSFPLGDDDVGFSGKFSNPDGFSGTLDGDEVTLVGTARFKLTGFSIPGVDVPPLLGLLPCHFDFEPDFTGDYDAEAGLIEASDRSITVPRLPGLCAGALNLAIGELGVDIDINEIIDGLGPASATVTLDFDEPLVTTTTTSTTTTSTTTTVPAPSPSRLDVFTDPPVASQITVDGLIADDWGVHGLEVTPDTEHQVCFGEVPEFTAPDCVTVTVEEGQTRTVVGAFVPDPTTWLAVKTDPPVNARLTIDGNPANNWGVHGLAVSPGEHEVCFGEVADFTAPDCVTVTVEEGSFETVTGSYTPDPGAPGPDGFGLLRVQTSPAVPSEISVDGAAADTWGLDWLQIDPGEHEVCFGAVAGFATPDCATVTVTDGQVTEVTGAFTADGHLDISTDPGGDVEITVNTDATPLARGNWSMHIAVPPGDYQVCFGDRADVGPATDPADGCTSVTVPVGQTVPVIGHYPS